MWSFLKSPPSSSSCATKVTHPPLSPRRTHFHCLFSTGGTDSRSPFLVAAPPFKRPPKVASDNLFEMRNFPNDGLQAQLKTGDKAFTSRLFWSTQRVDSSLSFFARTGSFFSKGTTYMTGLGAAPLYMADPGVPSNGTFRTGAFLSPTVDRRSGFSSPGKYNPIVPTGRRSLPSGSAVWAQTTPFPKKMGSGSLSSKILIPCLPFMGEER